MRIVLSPTLSISEPYSSTSIIQNVSRATQRKEAWFQQALRWEQEARLGDTILRPTFDTVAA